MVLMIRRPPECTQCGWSAGADGYKGRGQVQSAVALAVCMFGMSLHHYRRTGRRDGTALDGLCGDAKDIAGVELGITEQDRQGRET